MARPILAPMDATDRWGTLVGERLAETRRLAPGDVPSDVAFWDAQARRMASRIGPVPARDPVVGRLRRLAGRGATVLDVGAGAGRFALGLAPYVREVTAVDASAGMLRQLRRRARTLGVDNIHCVQGRWEEVDVLPADLAFAAYVLPLVEDAAGFLERLDATAGRRAAVVVSAVSADAVWDVLWRHFHGGPRRPGPTWLDAVAVLRELGMDPHVEVVEPSYRGRYATMREAVDDARRVLALADDADVKAELRRVLGAWLVPRDGGLSPPVRTLPAAVVSWQPRGTAATPDAARRRRDQDRKAHDE